MDNGGTVACLLVVVGVVVLFVWAARRPRREAARLAEEVSASASLPDDQALRAARSRYERLIGGYYGSPETIAAGGYHRLQADDPGAALFFYQKSIDLLHTLYVFSEMRGRQPSDRDAAILDSYLAVLARVRARYPAAAVADSVREVTHRLRTISSACRAKGQPPHRYLDALTALARIAPEVGVDDVFW